MHCSSKLWWSLTSPHVAYLNLDYPYGQSTVYTATLCVTKDVEKVQLVYYFDTSLTMLIFGMISLLAFSCCNLAFRLYMTMAKIPFRDHAEKLQVVGKYLTVGRSPDTRRWTDRTNQAPATVYLLRGLIRCLRVRKSATQPFRVCTEQVP